jgi:hypothetical protein
MLAILLILPSVHAFIPPSSTPQRWSGIKSTLGSSKLLESDADLSADIRKWHFLTHKSRPDDVYVSRGSALEATTDIWKSVLVSLRVLENLETETHTSIIAFTDIPFCEQSLAQLKSAAGVVETSLVTSSSIFQPNFVRRVSVLPFDSKYFVCSVETRREKPVAANYDDLDSYIPPIEDIITNDIPGFPFDNIYDFIAEINRPVDKVSMQTLRFRYSIQDLKIDAEKMKKKKDPQEMVDNINCKLTRLAGWRDILSSISDGPDFFNEEVDWSEKVKLRYQSMKALIQQSDPSRLLDTQYDKKKTFTKIIDQWMDRLKRNFKFIYQSQREPIDFSLQVMDSSWRTQLVGTTRVLSRVPVMDLGGPEFTPGSPSRMFSEDRQLAWPPNYQVEIALFEMLSWLRSVDKVRGGVGLSSPSISVLSFARGWVTESLVVDTWGSLLAWLAATPADVVVPHDTLSSLGLLVEEEDGCDVDHMTAFLAALETVNAFVRARSVAESKNVKHMFSDWIKEGRHFLDWFTTLVKDMDLVEKMESMDVDRARPWSELIQEMLYDELVNSETDVNENVVNPEATMAMWDNLRCVEV